MKSAAKPTPPNEAARLSAARAYECLDSEPELEFDALTRIAAQAFGAPIAYIGMLDSDRLWLKSRLGLNVRELARDETICAHTVMNLLEPFVVEDLGADERFKVNPLGFLEPQPRFYAGAPIVDRANHALGTIAVLDVRPRTFSDAQRTTLMDLATAAMTALQARRNALELARLAMTDSLTKLGNRARLEQSITIELSHARRHDLSFALLSMDIDGLKRVNDLHGHSAGDEVLCLVTERLNQLVRDGDTLVRLGGDEFAIVSRHCDKDKATALAERIAKSIHEPMTLASGAVLRVAMSIGIVAYTNAVSSVDMLLSQADQALYRAKQRSISRRLSPLNP
ncbi:MAG: sensor domain-containing diguanylate cyclase [Steroidobacteraceae bacterium]|jgi:diguanylate cyclase (GGDEF)-like protein